MGYKIAIIDDEALIRQSIRHKIQLEEAEVVYDTDDGEAFLKYLKKNGIYSVDIALVDIKMPYMNGLDLICELKKIAPGIVCVILSGYSDFPYMQKAIQFGVKDYILKPVDRQVLNESLEKMLERVDEIREERIEKCIDELSAWIVQKGETCELSERTREIFAESFPNGYQVLLCLEGNWKSTAYWVGTKNKEPWSFADIQHPNLMVTLYESGRIIRTPNGQNPFTMTFYKGVVKYRLEELKPCILEGMEKIRRRLTLEKTVVTEEGQEADMGELLASWEQKEKEVLSVIEKHKNDQAYYLIYDKLKEMQGEKEIPQYLREAFWKKAVAVLCMKNGTSMDSMEYLSHLETTFRECDTNEEYLSCILRSAREILENQKEESVCNASALVDRMVSDIHEKFGEDLNLKAYADSAYVNRSHLSRVFKQKTGETFNEYLTRIRIQNACRMLREERYSVTEIAFLAGYQDNRYFSQVFFRIMQLTPSEYRKRWEEERH